MPVEKIKIDPPFGADGVEMTAITVNDEGIYMDTNTHQSVEVAPESIAHILQKPYETDTFENRLQLVKDLVSKHPVHWTIEGEQLIGHTLSGNTVTKPLQEVAKVHGLEGHSHLVPTVLNAPALPQRLGEDKISIGKLAGGLAKGLAGQLGSFIGGLIIDAIFPQKSMQDYFDEFYDKISKMVHEEIVQNTINVINGKIMGTQDFIRTVYAPLKKSGAPKEELFAKLDPYVNALFLDVVSTLTQDNYRKPGFSVYLLGASMQIALLQEQALVDPKVANPRDSSYAKSTSQRAKDCLAHAKATWNDILETRLAFIHTESGKGTRKYHQKLIDDLTGQVIFEGDLVKWLFGYLSAKDNYIEKVTKELSEGFAGEGGIEQLFANWESLIDNPIPKV